MANLFPAKPHSPYTLKLTADTMRTLLLLLCLATGVGVSGQPLERVLKVALPPMTNPMLEWVDLDQDSLLDLVLLGEQSPDHYLLLLLHNEGTSYKTDTLHILDFTPGQLDVNDLDHDGFLDLQITNAATNEVVGYFNQRGWAEQLLFTLPEKITALVWSDLNGDGNTDGVVGTTQSLKVFTSTSNTIFHPEYDTLLSGIQSITINDYDHNGIRDLVISGKTATPFLLLATQRNFLKFKFESIQHPVDGKVTTADFNEDGLPDVIVTSSQDSEKIAFYTNTDSRLERTDSLTGIFAKDVFAADFNSDGQEDLVVLGKKNNEKYNALFNGVENSLDTTGVLLQKFADGDFDGDLDVVQLRDSLDHVFLTFLKNSVPVPNLPPSRIADAFGVIVFNRLILNWEQKVDDHTPVAALTYDLTLLDDVSGKTILAGNFLPTNGRRNRAIPGNQGHNTFTMLKVKEQLVSFIVQPVDNSLFGTLKQNLKGKCSPVNFNSQCTPIAIKQQEICIQADTLQLTSPAPALWFSFQNGFLGKYQELEFIPDPQDTIISIVPGACPIVSAFTFHSNPLSAEISKDVFVCKGTETTLEVGNWPSLIWIKGTDTLKTATLTLQINQPVQVTALATSGACTQLTRFQIEPSEPQLQTENDMYMISVGDEVQLQVTEGYTYSWSPASGLSNSTIANPIAAPIEDTRYVVTAFDSLGCSNTLELTIKVIQQSFLPSLFSPNDDGRNDELRILGLREASEFHFQIFNRNGSLVYESKDFRQVSTVGWNGAHQGIAQATGVYYWKVRGKSPNGKQLLINGKDSGSILLVR